MTTVVPNNIQFFGRSTYISNYRQDFKHLNRTGYPSKGPDSKTRSILTSLANTYLSRSYRRSMVKDEQQHKKSIPREAGQATSPQSIARNTLTPAPASRRASPSVENTIDYGQQEQSRATTAMPPSQYGGCGSARKNPSLACDGRYSREFVDESDTDSDCCTCSDDEPESNVSSRATSPEDDDFDAGKTFLVRRKRQIVDSAMQVFRWAVYKWLSEVSGIVVHAGEGGAGRKRSADKISGRQSRDQPPTGGKKRPLRDEKGGGAGGEEHGDEDGDDKSGNKKTKREPKFACPYYKHNPVKYREHRTCLGPGWISVHRVKEHLFRKHMAPKYICHDCNEPFDTTEQFATHFRATENCSKNKIGPPDGIDEPKLILLKARQTPHTPEKQKWEQMYRILFPDDDVIPTPYYDDETEARRAKVPEDVALVADFFKNEVFPQARRDLEREVDSEIEGVSKRVKAKAFEMVENAIFRAMRVWEYGRRQTQPSSLPSSPKPDSGLATPEPDLACLPPVPDLGTMIPNMYDFQHAFATSQELFQDTDLFAAGFGEYGGAGSNFDSAYGTNRDEFSVASLPDDLNPSSLGF